MKKFILLSFILLSFYSFAEEKKTYYKNGQVKFLMDYVDGNISGRNNGFYNDGSIWYEIQFKDGKKDGKSEKYYKNGQLKYIRFYSNGVINNGDYSTYHYNGKRKSLESYQNGKLHGLYIEFWDTGIERFRFNYVDGYDEEGFDYMGIHKDTGTNISPSGKVTFKYTR